MTFRTQAAFNAWIAEQPPTVTDSLVSSQQKIRNQGLLQHLQETSPTPLPSPLYLDYTASSALEAVSLDITQLLKELSVAHRPGDWYAGPHSMLSPPQSISISRCDFLWTSNGWQLVEVNFGAACGGIDISLYHDALRQSVDQRLLSKMDSLSTARYPFAVLREHAVRNATSAHLLGQRPRIAIVDDARYIAAYLPAHLRMASFYEACGYSPTITTLEKLTVVNGAVGYLGDAQIDAIHREVILEDLLGESASGHAFELLSSNRDGSCLMISDLGEELAGRKSLLANLFDYAHIRLKSPERRDRLVEVLPEARHVTDASEVPADWANWVLKPELGSASQGVVLGARYEDRASFVRAAADRDDDTTKRNHLCQRFLKAKGVPLPIVVERGVEIVDCQVQVSFFSIEGSPAGSWARATSNLGSSLMGVVEDTMYGGVRYGNPAI